MKFILNICLLFNFLICSTLYFQADPFYLFDYEKQQFESAFFDNSLSLRPSFSNKNSSKSNLFYNSWYYYNDNAPNLENTSNKWIGKGSNYFKSIHYDFFNDFLYFSIEPYFFVSENLNFNPILNREGQPQEHTDPIFLALNNNRVHNENPFISSGLRESQLIVHKNDFGIGFSNTNLWWGPGIHNSLHISNNTTGFNYFYLGTNTTKRINNFGYNFKYVFSKLDKNIYEPYYTGFAADITYYGSMVTTFGFYRSFLSSSDASIENLSIYDSMALPFQSLFKKTLTKQNNNIYAQDDVDQTLSIFVRSISKRNKFIIFFEYGWNDHRWDKYDFFQHPDHSGASMIGFRKYNLFNNDNLLFGFEYTNLIKGKFSNRTGNSNWFDKEIYDYNKFEGRRFTAHIGADADDLMLYFGYISEIRDMICYLNYERHGVIESIELSDFYDELLDNPFHVPEYKIEFKIDYRQSFKYFDAYLFYEFEYLDNIGIPIQDINPRYNLPKNKSNVFGVGITKVF